MAEVLAKDAEIGKVYQSPRGVKVKVIEKKEEGLLRIVAESIKTGNRILLPDDYLLIETDTEESPKAEEKPVDAEVEQETAEAKPEDVTAEAKPEDASAEAKPEDASVEAKPEDASAEAKPEDASVEAKEEPEAKAKPRRRSRSKENGEIKQMLLQGMSVSEIAKALGVNYRTVYPKVRRLKAAAEKAGMSLEDYLKSIE